MYKKVAVSSMIEVKGIISFTQGQFSFQYLGCPVTHARKIKEYYNALIKKVKNKLQNWKGKLLYLGAKVF